MAGNIRKMVGAGLGQLISKEQGTARLDDITVEGDDESWTEAFRDFASIEGLDQVCAHFNDDRSAFEWLNTANVYTAGTTPIGRLRRGYVDEVVRAAKGALDIQ